jgi:subtilisin family serine protease
LGNTKTGTPDGDADVADAWDATTGSPETVIAVLDDGVDIAHPDLAANIWTNDGEVPGNGVDDDGNGYADDVHGWDFGRNDANPSPDPGGGHGTHVAGIIAAVANNGQGIAGACPGCRIMPLKFAFDTASEIEAIAYAIANGADVVNMSYGQTNVWIPAEHRAIAALGRAGILVVASAANSNGDNDMYLKADVDGDGRFDYDSPGFPASYGLSNIVSVAASNDEDKLGYSSDCALLRGSPEFPCTFTNYGRESVDLAAPGVDILSTFPGGYEVWDGTSMAAPLVAGTAGLVKSLHPEYSPSQLRGALMNGAEVKETLSHLHAFPGLDIRGSFTRTNGRLNALSALTAATAVPPINDGSPKGARSLLRSARGTLSWPGDDNDFFKKRLRGGHAYKVVLDGPSGEDFDLVVWKPATMDVWQLEPGCFNGGRCPLKKAASTKASDESVRFRVPRSGAYYFQATSFLSRGHYTIKIKRVS